MNTALKTYATGTRLKGGTAGLRPLGARTSSLQPFPPRGGRGGNLCLCDASGEAAFTLIELIIAVGISAIVIASVSTLLFAAIRLREGASDAAEESMPVDRAIAIMKRDFLGIVPPGVLAGPMGSDAVGVNMSQPLLLEIFTASGVATADAPWGDVQKIDYSLQAPALGRRSAGRDLVRGVTRNLLATDVMAPEAQPLLSDVQSLQFSYYDGTNWNDVWSTSLSNLPIAIKVSIDFATSKTDTHIKPPVQFLVPIVTLATTNSITNQISN